MNRLVQAACDHPMYAVIPAPGKPGKSICLGCGAIGEIMTQGPGGILLPKTDLFRN